MKYNINIKIETLTFLLLLCSMLSMAQNWPLGTGNVQCQINSTFGECREARDHFHNGIDIQSDVGTPIYAIEGGTAFLDGGKIGINIGHYRYYHIEDIIILNQETVDAGDLIGWANSDNHLHFIECEKEISSYYDIPTNFCLNPLRDGGLTPFTDNGNPIIDNVLVYSKETGALFNGNIYYGKLDFTIQAHDPGVTTTGAPNYGSSCGVYNIFTEFRNSSNVRIGNFINYLTFEELPSNDEIEWAYNTGSSSSTFIYRATKDPFGVVYDKYWNSKRSNISSYYIDAKYPGQTMYPDGNYTAVFQVEDVDDNAANEEREIQIDNFRPYIQKVEIKSGTVDAYKGEWDWNAALLAIKYVPNGKSYSTNPADGIITAATRNESITVKVTASEPMNELNITDIVPAFQTQAINVTYPITGVALNTEHTEWEFTISSPDPTSNGNFDGFHNIHFDGLDFCDNQIECFSPSKTTYVASEIPKRTGATTWIPTPNTSQGYDNLHSFQIGIGGSLSVTLSASATQIEVGGSVDFTAAILETKSAKSIYTYDWVLKTDMFDIPVQTSTGELSISFSNESLVTAEVIVKENGNIVGSDVKKDIVNVGSVLQADIIIDKQVAMVNQTIGIFADAIGGIGDYTYFWSFYDTDCSLISSSNQTETIIYSELGTKTIVLDVTSGGITKTFTKTITISETPQLSVDFQDAFSQDYTIQPDELIQFISTVENASGIVEYYWDFGDGSYDWITNHLSNPTYSYSQVGEYTVTLRITADNGERIVSHRYRVSVLGTLDANFTYSAAASTPDVTFTVTSNESATAILYYGDGSSSGILYPNPYFPVTVTKSYQNGGDKSVILRVVHQGEWINAREKTVSVNGSVSQPEIMIGLNETLPHNRPWLSATVYGITPWPNPGLDPISDDSPNEIARGNTTWYHYGWFSSGIDYTFFSHADEPYTYLNVNFPDVKTKFNNNLPYIFTAKMFVTDVYGDDHVAEREITLYPPVTADLKTVYTACEGTEIELIPDVMGGKPPYEYEWINETTGAITNSPALLINVTDQPITYTFTIKDARSWRYGGYNYYEKTFTVQAYDLTVDVVNSVTLCDLIDTETINATVSGGSQDYTISWEPYNHLSSTTILNPVVAATSFGTKTYTVRATDEYGCTAIDQVNVNVYEPLQIDLEPIYYLNGVETITISPTITGGSGNYSFSWINGASTKDIQVNYQSDFTQTLTVTDNISGCSQISSCKVLNLASRITNENSITRGKNVYEITIPVTSSPGNISYSASTNVDWATITSGANGFTGYNIVLDLKENNTSGDRVGVLTITSPEVLNSPYEIVITQTIDEIIYVPTEYSTIQAAIDAALDGGKVEVYEGTYREYIYFSGSKTISVKAIGCPENTIIKGKTSSDHQPLVYFYQDNSTLQGFTITGNDSDCYRGGGINSYMASPKLYDLIISNNKAHWGAGMNLELGDPIIVNVKIINNTTYGSAGGGIMGHGNTFLENVLITGNITDYSGSASWIPDDCLMTGGAGMALGSGTHRFKNVTIHNNNVKINGTSYAIYEDILSGVLIGGEDTEVYMDNCIVTDIINTLTWQSHSNSPTIDLDYSNITEDIKGTANITWGEGNILNTDPMLDSDFGLLSGSPCIDAGSPYSALDKDGTRNDMGFTGGKDLYNTTNNFCRFSNQSRSSFPPKIFILGENCDIPMVYSSGESDEFIARQQIILKPGFEARSGSNISLKIEPFYNEPFLYDDKCNFMETPVIPEVEFEPVSPPLLEYPKTDNKFLESEIRASIYPNPTNSNFIVEILGDPAMVQSIEIYNVQGQFLKSLENKIECYNDFDINKYPQGIYFIKINYFENQIIKKIIKE